jgi:hypothetical protein
MLIFQIHPVFNSIRLKTAIAVCAAALLCTACAAWQYQETDIPDTTLSISDLIDRAVQAALRDGPAAAHCPPGLEILIADGRITVGLGIGTQDLGQVRLPEDPRQWKSSQTCRVFGREIIIDARLILTREDFRSALQECEVIFIASHSRFGAGPVFLHDGKANPFLMQTTPGYEISMPDSEVAGYQGTVLRRFHDNQTNKGYTVFAPDGSDLERSCPLRGYQVLIMSTCSSMRHFFDDIADFRQNFPTTAIFTSRPSLMDLDKRVFMRMLYELLRGASSQGIVDGLNEEYRAAAWAEMKRGRPPWRIVDNLFVLGIDTVVR